MTGIDQHSAPRSARSSCRHQARGLGIALACAVVLSGCANFSPDQGMGPVGSLASAELGKDVVKIRNEADAVRRRHGLYVMSFVDGLDDRLDGPDAAIWYERVEAEHDNVRTALRWAMESGEVELGLQLIAQVGKSWDQRGYVNEGLAYIESFLCLPTATRWTIGRGMATYVASRMNESP